MPPTNVADTVSLISAAGTTYYFHDNSGTRVAYTGANTPWTAAATSCYELANNPTAGPIWVPQSAHGQMIYGGGPPFSLGRQPAYRSFDLMTETTGVQVYATTKDGAIFLLQQLKRILNTALVSQPCILAVKSGTNTDYTEITSADIDESTMRLVEPNGTWRATMTWTRQPFFGLLSTGETLLNGLTFTNTGTGANNNTQAYSTGSGDLINEGQPLNIKVDPTNVAFASMILASVKSRTYNATSAGAFSTSGNTIVQAATLDCTNLMNIVGLSCRVLVRLSAASANARFQYIVRYSASLAAFSATRAPYVTPPGTSTQIVDLGPINLSFLRRVKGMTAPAPLFQIVLYSSDGASATCTFSYSEILFYYDFCTLNLCLDTSAYTITANDLVLLDAFPEQSGAACLPYPTPQTLILDSSTTSPIKLGLISGRAPRYFSGASLYAAWFNNPTGSLIGRGHTTNDTAVITATHAPLYYTARGAG